MVCCASPSISLVISIASRKPVLRMIKEPARSEKAVLLPSVMAPIILVNRPVRRVAGIGQLRFSLT